MCFVDPGNYTMQASNGDLLAEDIVRKHVIFPLFKIDNILTLAMSDPTNLAVIDQVRMRARCEIEPVVCTKESVGRLIDRAYTNLDIQDVVEDANVSGAAGPQLDAAEERPVIRLVDSLLSEAVRDNGSDVHIEPESDQVRVRFRIDGVLREMPSLDKRLQSSVVSRIKVMENLDVTQSRIPQD